MSHIPATASSAIRITPQNRQKLDILNGGLVPGEDETESYFIYPAEPFEPCQIIDADDFHRMYEFLMTEDDRYLVPFTEK